MRRIISIFILSLVFSLAMIESAQAQFFCHQIYEHQIKVPPVPKFEKVSKDDFMNFRSNPDNTWAEMAKEGPKHFAPSLLKTVGIVMGDAHGDNFSEIPMGANKETIYSTDDVDSSGEAPVFLEFAGRFVIGSKIALPKEAELTSTLFKKYRKGLEGEEPESVPKSIRKALEMTDQEYQQKMQDFAKENSSKRELKKKDLKLEEITQGPARVRGLFPAVKFAFQGLYPKAEILDYGFKIKTEGGSRNKIRFWFLIETSEGRRIIEMKEQPQIPSTGFFQPQKSFAERFEDFKAMFWKYKNVKHYKAVTVQGIDYLVRTRYEHEIETIYDPEMSQEDYQEFLERTLYDAWFLGYILSQHPAGKELELEIKKLGPDNVLEMIKGFSKYYRSKYNL